MRFRREGIGRRTCKVSPNMDGISVQFNYFFLSNIPKCVPDVSSVCSTTSSKRWIHKIAPCWEFRRWWSWTLKMKPSNKILSFQSSRMFTMYFGAQVPLFYAKDGGRWFPCNFSTHLQDYTSSHFRTLYSYAFLWCTFHIRHWLNHDVPGLCSEASLTITLVHSSWP